jgi:hypothetical protein
MRQGEIAKLEWTGFDRETWTLTLPGRITKNRRPRRLALEGPLRVIIERRLAARRLDCRKIAMAISGHRTEAVFERYNIDTDDDLRQAVGKLSSYVNGLPTAQKVAPLLGKAER